MPRRLLAVGIGLVCLAGAAALLLAIPALFQPWARAYDSHLLTLTISFAIVSLWPQRLPSGSTFLPGVALSVAGLFLLPPILTVLVPVPGLICHTVAMRRHWWHYLQTIGHGAISLYLGALTYVWLAPEGPLTLPASLPGALAALAVNEVVQRLISIVIVAYRLRRGLLDQAHRHLLDRNWGSFGLTLMGLTAALAYQNDGDLGASAPRGPGGQPGSVRQLLHPGGSVEAGCLDGRADRCW